MPSEKTLQLKKKAVEELTVKIKNSKSMVLADYRGLTVEQDTQLRNDLRKAGVEYRVVKNTLTQFAAKETGLEELGQYLSGPTAIAFSESDLVAPAKVLADYAKKFDKLEIKAGVVEGKIIDLTGVKALAELPPREVLVAQVLGTLNAPITGFVTVLNANIRGLAVALQAIADKKASA